MADEKKGRKISRRTMLLGTAAGVFLGANLVVVLVKNSKNKPESLTLQFTGPFDYSQLVPFKAPEHSPVDINSIRFAEKEFGTCLCLDFKFTGKEDPKRIIDLMIEAKDSNGRVIAKECFPCDDARLYKSLPGPTRRWYPYKVNVVNALLNGVKPEQIAMLEVKFSQK
jgi:hypothetical protein